MREPLAESEMVRAIDAVRRGPSEMLALAKAWVEINSFTENVEGVNRVGELLVDGLRLPGLEHSRVPGGGSYGDHHVFRTAASRQAGARPIVLIGHHDTVFPPGHFETWVEKDGRICAPGILDMKGGLAVIRQAFAALSEIGRLEQLPLVLVIVGDEEVGSPSSSPLLKELAKGASCALVFESGRAADAIITRRKGVGAMQCVFHGVAAHAGNNHKDGANAVWAASKFVDTAQALTDYARGVTVNVGTIKGGTSKNTVPERCEAALDLRYETVADAEEVVNGVRAAAERAAQAVPGVRVEVSGGARRLPMERTAQSLALKEEYGACARLAGLGDGEAALIGGGSDANTVAAMGIPSIDGLGPRGAGFHTTNEYVEVASFVPKAEALTRFLLGRLAG